jgi:putative membrane protein
MAEQQRRDITKRDGCVGLLIKWAIAAVALYVTAWLLPDHGMQVQGFRGAVIAAAVIGLLNALVRPILIVLTLPITIVTLGLFLIVINALMLLLADWLLDSLDIGGFWWAVLGAIVLALVGMLVDAFVRGLAGERTEVK